jgi:hypothetical protein
MEGCRITKLIRNTNPMEENNWEERETGDVTDSLA